MATIEEDIEKLKKDLEELKDSNREVLDWIRTGRLIVMTTEKAGSFVVWFTKLVVAILTLYAAATAFKHNVSWLPDKLFPFR
jgi:hypothetical protein